MSTPRPLRKHMVRREEPNGTRFVTFSCQGRLPLLKNPAIANLFIDRVAAVREATGLQLFAYVVMPEHVHLLIRPPQDTPLDRILVSIKQPVARAVIMRWKELHAPILSRVVASTGHRFWQKGGGFDRNVRDATEFSREVRYIHQNPVARGLVARADQYEWSSVHQWLSRHRGHTSTIGVPCDPPPGRQNWTSWRGFMDAID